MLGSILVTLVVAVAPATAAPPIGQITATTGKVFLFRDGRRYRAEVRAALHADDRVETRSGSGAGLFLYRGQALLLAPETSVALGGPTSSGTVRLDRGEVRATVDAPGGLAIVTPLVRVQTARGVLHTSSSPAGTRLWAEAGGASITTGECPPAAIREGQESFVEAVGSPRPTVASAGYRGPIGATGQGWTVRPDALRLAGAAADSRRLLSEQIPAANDATAIAFQPSGQMGPSGPSATAPGSTPSESPETTPTPANVETPPADDETSAQPIAFAQPNSSFSISSSSIAFSGAAGSFSSAFSSGLGSDAQQDSRTPGFPGNIHLITAASQYNLNQVRLTAQDTLFPTSGSSYYSIGVGPPPTGQVVTSFLTGTGPTPYTIPIPHFHAYLINLSQFPIPDPAKNQNSNVFSGISGLLGANPTAPQIRNATPLTDPRAVFNDRATFALGEFALQRTGKHMNIPQLELRRSDQDRQIIPLSATTDKVTPNPDVAFTRQADTRFFPEFGQRGVFVPVPNSVKFPPKIGTLDPLRKAAVTTLVASALLNYSHRTGQTQFAIGNQVIDISGFHRPAGSATVSPATARAGVPDMTTLRSLGPRPEATRSVAIPGGAHASHHR